ncbi:MAG: hypothetical protein LBD85_01065 [Oscillospiraceae bacterium]|jgi:hypothetical protein|nr:hypothetical protein [Oscillospiraceae bacterium]
MLWLSDVNKKEFGEKESVTGPFKYGVDNALLEVSRALETDSYDARKVRSIPDIYSKAHLFDMAIRQADSNSDDAFFKNYKSWIEYEWRAMVAVLVLAENLGVKVRAVPFYPSSANPEVPAKFGEDGKDEDRRDVLSPLEKIIYRSRPTFELWKIPDGNTVTEEEKYGWSWGNGMVFQVCPEGERPVPIAFTSPTTLIVPAADGWKTLWKHYGKIFTWIEPFAGERGIDPNKMSDENPSIVLKRDFAEYLPVLYSWLELYRLKLAEKAVKTDWCAKKETVGYLCAPFAGVDKDGILCRFIKDLGFSSIDRDTSEVFTFTNITSLLAPYVPSNVTHVGMDYANIAVGSKVLFIDCDAERIGGHELEDVIAIDRLSVKRVRDEHFAEIEAKRKFDANEVDQLWTSPLLDRIRSRARIVFSDELLLPQAACAYYKGNKGVCADAVVPDVGTFYVENDSVNPNIKDRTYWVPMPLTESGFKFYSDFSPQYRISGGFHRNSYDIWKITIAIDVPMEEGSAGSVTTGGVTKYTWRKTYTNALIENPDSDMRTNPVQIIQTEMTESIGNILCTSAIWPRLPIDGWESYYFFCLKLRTYYLKPLGKLTDEATGNPKTYSGGNLNGIPGEATYYRLDEFPQYLEFYNGRDELLGYVPLNCAIAQSPGSANTYKVAVDFGTSSTSIYRQLDSNPFGKFGADGLGSAAVCFNPAFNDGGVVDYLTQYFIPHNSKPLPIPFQTIIHDNKKDETARSPVFDTLLFFKLLTPQQDDPVRGSVNSNLKWSRGTLAGNQVNMAFRQIARYAVLDAIMRKCKTIELFASYPGAKAGGNAQIKQLGEQFRSTISQDIATRGANKQPIITLLEHPLITEGLAAAKHFQANVGNEKFRCVIDIGGGTSDYFIYQRAGTEEPLYSAIDSSVKFGARNMLIRLLQDDAANIADKGDSLVCHMLTSNDVTIPYGNTDAPISAYLAKTEITDAKERAKRIVDTLRTSQSSTSSFAAEWETVLAFPVDGTEKTVGDFIHQAMTGKGDKRDERGQRFLTILAVGIAAIAYYGGMLARTFPRSIENIDLHFAGNGSKVLNWLDIPADGNIRENALDIFLGEVFKRALMRREDEDDFTLQNIELTVGRSNKPKLEAVSGMLSDAAINLIDGGKATTVTLAGESFVEVDGTEHKAIDKITDDHIYKIVDDARQKNVYPGRIKTTEFDHFVEAFNMAVVEAFGRAANRPVLVLDYKRNKNGFDFGQSLFTFNVHSMNNARESTIDKYITGVINDREGTMERTPFFFKEVELLIDTLVNVFAPRQ